MEPVPPEEPPPLPDKKNPPPLPEQIGPYRIEKFFSRGGMAILYLAKDPKREGFVILKVLRDKLLENRQILHRLLHEAKVLSLLKHPNIVQFYDLGEWEKGIYLAMEYVPGISLYQAIRKQQISGREGLVLGIDLAKAVAYLHSHGVIHRDLKPENVLLSESGVVKLIDFGLSQFLVPENGARLTKIRSHIGTPMYMSPEQRETPDQLSYATDIYSLGMILYELYLGKISHGQIRLDILPKGLRVIIEKALKLDPKERYPDVLTLIEELSSYLEQQEGDLISSEQVHQAVQALESILIPKHLPSWAEVSMGLSFRGGSLSHALYLDFFSLPKKRYGIVFAEPKEKTVRSLAYLPVFRGMCRALLPKMSDSRSIEVLESLHQTLLEDPFHQPLEISFLLLDLQKNLLFFAASQTNALFHFQKQTQQPHILSGPNPPLGAERNPSFTESEDRWEEGSTLIFPSFAAAPYPGIELDLLLSSDKMAQVILGHLVKDVPPLKTLAVLTISRI